MSDHYWDLKEILLKHLEEYPAGTVDDVLEELNTYIDRNYTRKRRRRSTSKVIKINQGEK